MQESVAVWKELANKHPLDVRRFPEKLFATYENLGRLHFELGDLLASRSIYETAIKMLSGQPLLCKHDGIDTEESLRRLFESLDQTLSAMDKENDVIDVHKEAIGISRQLVGMHPDVAEYRSILGSQFRVLGETYTRLGQQEKAMAAMEKSSDLDRMMDGEL